MRCDECSKREVCMVLCDEAEEYVNQDEVSQRELIIGLPYIRPLKIGPNIYLTPKQKEIVTLLGKGLNRTEVCQMLGITRLALRLHIHRMKEKRNDFDP